MTIDRCLLLAAACVAAGCGPRGISAPPTVPASGRVLVKGKPSAGIRVTLHPKFDMGPVKFTPSGETGKDGRFTITTGAPSDGAPPGDYAVTFDYPRVWSDRKGSGLEVEVDAWKGKYADPKAGKFQVTVQSGKDDLGTFSLD